MKSMDPSPDWRVGARASGSHLFNIWLDSSSRVKNTFIFQLSQKKGECTKKNYLHSLIPNLTKPNCRRFLILSLMAGGGGYNFCLLSFEIPIVTPSLIKRLHEFVRMQTLYLELKTTFAIHKSWDVLQFFIIVAGAKARWRNKKIIW